MRIQVDRTTFRNQYGQNFVIIYDELDPSDVHIIDWSDDWYEKRHEGWMTIRKKLTKSIIEHGQNNPICVIIKDGKYICNHGRQRLTAVRDAGLEKVKVLISYKESQFDTIPDNKKEIRSLEELRSYFDQDITKVNIMNHGFEIILSDRPEWDPNELLHKTT